MKEELQISDIVPVVEMPDALDNAEHMGFRRFRGMDIDNPQEIDVSHFHDSSTYANYTLPTLRSMAGYDDSGYGTNQINQLVIAVDEPEDSPAEGQVLASHQVLDELIEAWHEGAYKALEKAADE